MRLKEIKSNMAIHCKNKEEYKELCSHCKDYIDELSFPADTYLFYIRDGINMTWSTYKAGLSSSDYLVEFSDLIIEDEIELSSEEELTAEEAIKWLMKGCFDSRLSDIGGEDGDIYSVFDNNSAEEIINKIKKYNKNHAVSKEPEIEWVWTLDCTWLPRQYFNSEEEAIKCCEGLAKNHTSKEFTYKKICRVKEN